MQIGDLRQGLASTVGAVPCRCENTRGTERQLRFLVYHLESACRAADEAVAAGAGEGKMTWLIDFEGYSFSNAPSIRTSLSGLGSPVGCLSFCMAGQPLQSCGPHSLDSGIAAGHEGWQLTQRPAASGAPPPPREALPVQRDAVYGPAWGLRLAWCHRSGPEEQLTLQPVAVAATADEDLLSAPAPAPAEHC